MELCGNEERLIAKLGWFIGVYECQERKAVYISGQPLNHIQHFITYQLSCG